MEGQQLEEEVPSAGQSEYLNIELPRPSLVPFSHFSVPFATLHLTNSVCIYRVRALTGLPILKSRTPTTSSPTLTPLPLPKLTQHTMAAPQSKNIGDLSGKWVMVSSRRLGSSKLGFRTEEGG